MKQTVAERLEQGPPPCAGVLAPELDLLARPVSTLLTTKPLPADLRARLLGLRDELVQQASHGRFADAAAREWSLLPISWRMALLMMGGVGQDVDSLGVLAQRGWHEMPAPEQETVRSAARAAKKYLCRLAALAARV